MKDEGSVINFFWLKYLSDGGSKLICSYLAKEVYFAVEFLLRKLCQRYKLRCFEMLFGYGIKFQEQEKSK